MAKKKKGKKGKGKKVRARWAALPQFGARRCVAPAGGWVVGFLWGAGGMRRDVLNMEPAANFILGSARAGKDWLFGWPGVALL